MISGEKKDTFAMCQQSITYKWQRHYIWGQALLSNGAINMSISDGKSQKVMEPVPELCAGGTV